MPIGRGLSRKRPRNDLDDYLDEVDSRLFCVTKADRQCLHRDLKAHVKGITTDPRNKDRFESKYQITMPQLREEIGYPETIALNYISSVGRKVPSIGLKILIGIMTLVFILTLYIGLDRFYIGTFPEVPNAYWLRLSGLGLSVIAVSSIVVLFLSIWKFERFHGFLAYLLVFFTVMSLPCSIFMAREITRTMYVRKAVELQDFYGLLFVIDIIILGLIGVYIYLKHNKVLVPKLDLVV